MANQDDPTESDEFTEAALEAAMDLGKAPESAVKYLHYGVDLPPNVVEQTLHGATTLPPNKQ